MACRPGLPTRRTTTRKPTTTTTKRPVTAATTTTTKGPDAVEPVNPDPANIRKFSMEIRPPVSWSYPFPDEDQARLRRDVKLQATSCKEAVKNIQDAFLNEIEGIRCIWGTNALPPINVTVSEGSCLQANIAKREVEAGKCSVPKANVPLNVLLHKENQIAIVGACNDGDIVTFTPKTITGSFHSLETLTDVAWGKLVSQLIPKLTVNHFVDFTKNLTLQPEDHKIFEMTIQPPASWSFAPDDVQKARRSPRSTGEQAKSSDVARQNALSAFQKHMNATLTKMELPGVSLGLTMGLPLSAKIVELKEAKCDVTNKITFVKKGKNIAQMCDGKDETPKKFELKVTGTLYLLNNSLDISEYNWKKIATDFDNRLDTQEDVIFISQTTMTDGVPKETTTAEPTTTVTDETTAASETSEAISVKTTDEMTTVTSKVETSTVKEKTSTEASTTTEVTTTTQLPIEEAGEQRDFSMEILPLVEWTYPYPSTRRLLLLAEGEPSLQASDATAAMKNIKNDIEKALFEISSVNGLPPVYFVVNGIPLQANIVEVAENNKCSVVYPEKTTAIVSENGKYIESTCNSTADIVDFPPLPVKGSFYTAKDSLPLGDNWSKVAKELQSRLEVLQVLFKKDLKIDEPDLKLITMDIQPPISWSFSPTSGSGLRRRPRSLTEQAKNYAEARKNVLNALQSEVDVFVEKMNLPYVKVDLLEGLPLPATIVKSCPTPAPSGLTVLLSENGQTIAQNCTAEGAKDYEVAVIGTMTSRNLTLFSEGIWDNLAADLQKTLEKDQGVVFRQNITVTERNPLTTTSVPTTTVASKTTEDTEDTDATKGEDDTKTSTKTTERRSSTSFDNEHVSTSTSLPSSEASAPPKSTSQSTTEESDAEVISTDATKVDTVASTDPTVSGASGETVSSGASSERPPVPDENGSQGDVLQGNVALIAADVPSAVDKEQATFVMAVRPPATWTYPSQIKFWRDGQKRNEREARKAIQAAVERAMHRVLHGYGIPEEMLSVKINKDVQITADIVDRTDSNTCNRVSDKSVVLTANGKTIEKSCSRNGKVMPYNLVYIRGTFKAEVAASDDMWQILASELKNQLQSKENVVFTKSGRVIITPF